MTKESKTYNGERTVPSIKGVGRTEQPHARMKLDHYVSIPFLPYWEKFSKAHLLHFLPKEAHGS